MFKSCENINKFYRETGVPTIESTGFFGGRRIIWYPSNGEGNFQVSCHCSLITFGFGRLKVSSRMANEYGTYACFRGTPVVNEEGQFDAISPTGMSKHKFQLPKHKSE